MHPHEMLYHRMCCYDASLYTRSLKISSKSLELGQRKHSSLLSTPSSNLLVSPEPKAEGFGQLVASEPWESWWGEPM